MWQIEGLRQLPGVFLMDDGILALGSKEFMEENLSFTNYKKKHMNCKDCFFICILFFIK